MAKQFSFDIVSEFDFQELRNAVDQAKKELKNRFDFKGVLAEYELDEEKIVLKSESDFQVEALKQILLSKAIGRKLSPKIFDFGDAESIFGGNVKLEITLVKALDTENAKKISKLIRDEFKSAKPSIQGDAVRVTAKKKDDLQTVIQFIKSQEDLNVPLIFKNYR